MADVTKLQVGEIVRLRHNNLWHQGVVSRTTATFVEVEFTYAENEQGQTFRFPYPCAYQVEHGVPPVLALLWTIDTTKLKVGEKIDLQSGDLMHQAVVSRFVGWLEFPRNVDDGEPVTIFGEEVVSGIEVEFVGADGQKATFRLRHDKPPAFK